MNKIDLNVDLGEGCDNDLALLEFATSINVACGGHAGDAATMRELVVASLERDVSIGAHPSYPDRANFGRVSMRLSPNEIYDGVRAQIATLAAIAAQVGGTIGHVKPHGALYNDAERDIAIADAIVAAVRDLDPTLAVYGLAGGKLIDAARHVGLQAIGEAFADRGYTASGQLVPRTEAGALIGDATTACEQVLGMILHGRVRSRDGEWITLKPGTICLHGDGAHAVEFAKEIRAALAAHGIRIVAGKAVQRTV
ncbi:5-oxoprolinase subunit PxpA [Burkholderia territorii]|uniref:5-oxoprolinase subunit PxpA n=1 Tax=Burkholderia territorii TaxID=1503055 RepID=UPI0018C8AE35|nr:5-oxoprolinase subunit PxpA [Burkholderia territorii]